MPRDAHERPEGPGSPREEPSAATDPRSDGARRERDAEGARVRAPGEPGSARGSRDGRSLADGSDLDLALRRMTPRADDVDARQARSAVAAALFGAPPTPVTVGRYQIARRLGAGGMGVVYRAHDPELARDVAVKLLNSDLSVGKRATTARARLTREARAMARLAHPNVIHVYDVGDVADGVFIAMELVEGRDLATIHRDPELLATIPWTTRLQWCIQAGRGLAAAHAAGIVHRDFKPENVLVGDDGRVRVVDFGLAGAADRPGSSDGASSAETSGPHAFASSSGPHTLADAEPRGRALPRAVGLAPVTSSLTRTGALLGTPKYMPPEQYEGRTVTPASDQFSFAVATYEVLFGRPPFEGATVSAYREQVDAGAILPPPSDGPPVPVAVVAALSRAMATDPARRFPDMASLLDRLEAALAGATTAAAAGERSRTLRRALAGLTVAALTIAALGLPWVLARPAAAPDAPALAAAADAADAADAGVTPDVRGSAGPAATSGDPGASPTAARAETLDGPHSTDAVAGDGMRTTATATAAEPDAAHDAGAAHDADAVATMPAGSADERDPAPDTAKSDPRAGFTDYCFLDEDSNILRVRRSRPYRSPFTTRDGCLVCRKAPRSMWGRLDPPDCRAYYLCYDGGQEGCQ